jgi:Cu(I)/Ag(I) efflux system membrane fusion protein
MKRKWKFANRPVSATVYKVICFWLIIPCVFSISSCIRKEKQHPVSSNKTSDLGGLAQPSNQTVFSDVKTISPLQRSVIPALNATGIISYDPRLLNNISARFSGRIEKLYVRFNFENVSKGQRIMDIYSPEILTEQQNLIFLLNNSSNDSTLINASRQKLQLLGLTNDQLRSIIAVRKPINPLPVYSPYSGHIHDIGVSSGIASSSSPMNSGMSSGSSNNSVSQVQIENLPSSQSSELSIKEGMYIENGQAIFSVYNTNQVWAVLNIFPGDAALVKAGDKVVITAETNPGNQILSTISYIEPVAGQNASAIKARVYLKNADNLHLKIGTLLSAKLTAREVNGWWLPRNAVVNLGQRQIVFLKEKDHFITKTIKTGVMDDSLIQIISGLTGDEHIAENGQYMVDSESFIK